MPTTPETDYELVSNDGLFSLLRNDSKNIVILDCRSSNEFTECHIREAVNFSIPSIMLRRLAAGKIELASTIKCRELKAKICNTYTENLFVLYNDSSAVQHFQTDSVLNVLYKRLAQDGCRVVCLEGGFHTFRSAFPEWCESCSEPTSEDALGAGGGILPGGGPDPLPLMGLRSLRISAPPPPSQATRRRRGVESNIPSAANSSTDSSSDTDDRCDSSLGLDEDREFPVEILPYLFLGNAANSEDSQALAKHSIQYVLNVTPDLPNVFEDQGSIKYMQIPITDHWSQNLASHFPKAIEFIDEARSRQKGVLVHCLAGVSRSVTVTLAYLMYRCQLNLNDAFGVVRSRKADVAPNFHFMEQLHRFERELRLDVASSSPLPYLEHANLDKRTTNRTTNTSAKSMARTAAAAAAAGARAAGGGGGGIALGPCQNCGLNSDGCKCKSQSDFLSPLAHIGVSPDSGIEFDRWGSSTPGE